MEIDRNPDPPKLTTKAIELITKLCFRENDPLKQVDGIFVYSSIIGIADMTDLVETILSKNISKQIFITGGVTPKHIKRALQINTDLTEADIALNALKLDHYKNLNVYVEKRSTNTLENVTETLKNPEFAKCKSLLFVFKSHAAGRGYLTLRKFFQSAEILQQSFDAQYNLVDKKITRDNWYTFDFGRSRVWGEYLRIKTYGTRGDIEYNEVKDLVGNIEKET